MVSLVVASEQLVVPQPIYDNALAVVWCDAVLGGKKCDVRCGAVRCGAVRCGAVRCGVVWCDVVLGGEGCGVVLCGVVRCGVILYALKCCQWLGQRFRRG